MTKGECGGGGRHPSGTIHAGLAGLGLLWLGLASEWLEAKTSYPNETEWIQAKEALRDAQAAWTERGETVLDDVVDNDLKKSRDTKRSDASD